MGSRAIKHLVLLPGFQKKSFVNWPKITGSIKRNHFDFAKIDIGNLLLHSTLLQWFKDTCRAQYSTVWEYRPQIGNAICQL